MAQLSQLPEGHARLATLFAILQHPTILLAFALHCPLPALSMVVGTGSIAVVLWDAHAARDTAIARHPARILAAFAHQTPQLATDVLIVTAW